MVRNSSWQMLLILVRMERSTSPMLLPSMASTSITQTFLRVSLTGDFLVTTRPPKKPKSWFQIYTLQMVLPFLKIRLSSFSVKLPCKFIHLIMDLKSSILLHISCLDSDQITYDVWNCRRRCKKFYIEGPRKGSVDIFVENLPGFPDNVRYDGEGRYWIALSMVIILTAI